MYVGSSSLKSSYLLGITANPVNTGYMKMKYNRWGKEEMLSGDLCHSAITDTIWLNDPVLEWVTEWIKKYMCTDEWICTHIHVLFI